MLFNRIPKISICIPVYGTEPFLSECLESVAKQEIPDNEKNFFEVIVVDDCSQSKTGESAETIAKKFKKIFKNRMTFIRHRENKGVLEARRTAVYTAKGDYILMLDSDDSLPPNSLKDLYAEAVRTGADIVHGKVNVNFLGEITENLKKHIEKRTKGANFTFNGQLLDKQIFEGFLISQNHCGYLWAKLFSRELYLNAFSHIPQVFCVMADDVLQYFWISYEAKKYTSIDTQVYNYNLGAGITAVMTVEDMAQWQKICSEASVYAAIYSELDDSNIHISPEVMEVISAKCRHALQRNLKILYTCVKENQKDEARQILNDLWDENFVKEVELTLFDCHYIS